MTVEMFDLESYKTFRDEKRKVAENPDLLLKVLEKLEAHCNTQMDVWTRENPPLPREMTNGLNTINNPPAFYRAVAKQARRYLSSGPENILHSTTTSRIIRLGLVLDIVRTDVCLEKCCIPFLESDPLTILLHDEIFKRAYSFMVETP